MVKVHFVLMVIFAICIGTAFLHKHYKTKKLKKLPEVPTGTFTEKFGMTQVVLNITSMVFGISCFISTLVIAISLARQTYISPELIWGFYLQKENILLS